MLGLIGLLTDSGLHTVGEGARSTLSDAAAQFGGPGGGEAGPGGGGLTGKPSENRALGKHMAALMGWTGAQWNALDQLWTGESGWDDTVLNKQGSGAAGIPQDITGNLHGGAAGQIRWGLDYIKARYGDPRSALSFWLSKSPHWYGAGGLMSFITGGNVPIPGRGTAPPSVNPSDAITPHSRGKDAASKKKKKKKPGKPFTSGPNPPDLSKIKGSKAKKPKKQWRSRYGEFGGEKMARFGPSWARTGGGELPDVTDMVPDYDTLYEGPLDSADRLIASLQGRFDLSDEEAIVSLTDSTAYADLTAFWAQHPDLAKTYAGQVDSFDVLNTGGYTVQGKFIPGVDQHVNELLQIMGIHTGSGDPAGTGGMVGMLNAYADSVGMKGIPALIRGRDAAMNRLKQIGINWRYEHHERELDRDEIKKLSKGELGWEQRVNNNDAKIKVLQDYLREIDDAAVGHRLTDAAKRKKQRAHQQIADLRDESKGLRKNKPKAKSSSTNAKLNHLIASRDEHARELDFLAGSRDKFSTDNGVAADAQEVAERLQR